MYDLHEAREILEVEMAALATERASGEDKAELFEKLQWMKKSAGRLTSTGSRLSFIMWRRGCCGIVPQQDILRGRE